ncbi:hypothetical protein T265_08503 [Opisthorchis viverrini]|uniref:Uncharacterized protein n=1 Tax=Opisthorchis viverrini TaxID=6198 RepID=A0A074Z981_OPIVI|nr:hypothetical protein T265_08503 [Opisthorchis viverrini]KER23648.1 hypothetical protein T265_08503 [Opisthorchis viverrini]
MRPGQLVLHISDATNDPIKVLFIFYKYPDFSDQMQQLWSSPADPEGIATELTVCCFPEKSSTWPAAMINVLGCQANEVVRVDITEKVVPPLHKDKRQLTYDSSMDMHTKRASL